MKAIYEIQVSSEQEANALLDVFGFTGRRIDLSANAPMPAQDDRKAFEAWVDEVIYGNGAESISSDWDERRNCYSTFGHHVAYKAWQARAALLAVAEERQSEAVPDGHKIVPVEPTWEMLKNAWHLDGNDYAHTDVYRAMIAASPQAQVAPAMPTGWRFVEKKTCFSIHRGNEVIANLVGPDAEENAAIIASCLAGQVAPSGQDNKSCGKLNDEFVAIARADAQNVIDLLSERIFGSPARSPAHNARLVVERWLAAHAAEQSELATLRAQIAGMEKDAARYRWLKDNANIDYMQGDGVALVIPEPDTGRNWKADTDAIIDAALAPTSPEAKS